MRSPGAFSGSLSQASPAGSLRVPSDETSSGPLQGTLPSDPPGGLLRGSSTGTSNNGVLRASQRSPRTSFRGSFTAPQDAFSEGPPQLPPASLF